MQTTHGNKLIRWGIIGCGDVTEVKSGPAYQQTEGFELIAVMRRDEEKARDYARRHGVPKVYTDAAELIADPEVDAVYIATPPDHHHMYALMTAAVGKPCCIEKPMAPTYGECVEICAAFEQKNLPLFVAYYRRTLPRFTKIKSWLEQELIGNVRHVSWQFSKPPSAQDLSGEYNWRTDSKIAAGGYFDDLASHGLDLLAFYLGDFSAVSGFSTNQQKLYSAADALTACWVHENGITGAGSWNFGSARNQDRVEILGSKGAIEFAVFDEVPIRLTTEAETIEITIEHPKPVQLPHVQAMRDSLLNNEKHPSLGKTAAHTAWVMDRILGRI
ncbi:Gfo/Idh/MocA family oxidoreductase [Pontiellaceae bacterium B12219]|nr:Gfo/Idh/MocA family oxidoreductase [Pontiellaceae bacterium B12219]